MKIRSVALTALLALTMTTLIWPANLASGEGNSTAGQTHTGHMSGTNVMTDLQLQAMNEARLATIQKPSSSDSAQGVPVADLRKATQQDTCGSKINQPDDRLPQGAGLVSSSKGYKAGERTAWMTIPEGMNLYATALDKPFWMFSRYSEESVLPNGGRSYQDGFQYSPCHGWSWQWVAAGWTHQIYLQAAENNTNFYVVLVPDQQGTCSNDCGG